MPTLDATVRRNTFILAASLGLAWVVIQLMAGLAAVMMSHLSGVAAMAGFAPGVWLLGHAAGGYVTGRAMDAWGRRNGLLLAFLTGATGTTLVFLALLAESLPLFVAALVVTGLGTGGSNLARAAGADMYPPARRARGITLVLVGAAFGAIGAPLIFAPMLAGARGHDPAALAAPWPLATVVLLAGALLLLAIRVDPRDIAGRIAAAGDRGDATSGNAPVPPERPRSMRELLALPMVPLAMLAAIVAQGVMTATMSLVGLVLVDHGHDLGSVSVTMSAHFLGMFGLVLVVGTVVDRIGRFVSVLVGLVVMAAGALLMLLGVELVTVVPAMFLVGIGWNIAFVASTTILADAARPAERGRLLGFSDSVAIAIAAAMSVGAGLIVGTIGLPALIVVGVALALVPAALIAANRRRLEGVPSVPA
jgi:MFS family permease